MLYDIRLRVAYQYSSPAEAGRQTLCLMPATLPGVQRVAAGELRIAPEPAERIERTDFFGNALVDLAYRSAHAEIAFEVAARVERELVPPGLDMSPRPGALADEVAGVRSLAPDAPVHFIGGSPLVPPVAAITDYARDRLADGMSALDAVRALGAALHADMRYDSDATEVDTPISEAFAQRHGVCQDFSHIMIAGLRAVGIPAGYVSGFLRSEPPAGQPRLEGADAMHAWVRAWCGFEMGWVEYDPTNDLMVGTDHVVIAYGRDYADIAPVRGSFRSSGSHSSEQAVDVLPVG